ncbi:MAG: cell division protein FtsZ [Cytophagales bacterium]
MLEVSYKFEAPQAATKSIIKVIGVGGGGSNAVTHMYNNGIKDVEFYICNTDAQALKASAVPNKIQIGINLTEGLGAGSKPEVGKDAAIESKEDIRNLLSQDTKMVFITAGMGGGTGTGAAPVIAKIAKELDILTVGIVTAPFTFEGPQKRMKAEKGISEMKQFCDTVLVIMNDKLREVYGNLSIREAFSKADNILTNAAKCIAEIITVTGDVNVDFNDVRTVLKDSGAAVMGTGSANGKERASLAVEAALNSPLLNSTDVSGAKNVLIFVEYGDSPELTMDEMDMITGHLYEKTGYDAEIKFGQVLVPSLGDHIKATVIATGFEEKNKQYFEKTVYNLESNKAEKVVDNTKIQNYIPDTPVPTVNSYKVPQNTVPPQNTNNGLFEANSKYSVVNSQPIIDPIIPSSDPIILKEEKPIIQKSIFDEDVLNRVQAQKAKEQADSRMEKLLNLSKGFGPSKPFAQLKTEEVNNMFETPAYLRKGKGLDDTPHSSENNISRYNLNDDNDILGNNKFLHDNVD